MYMLKKKNKENPVSAQTQLVSFVHVYGGYTIKHSSTSVFEHIHARVFLQVRCDVSGTVAPYAGSDYSFECSHDTPSPPSQHFTEQSKHRGEIKNRPYVLSLPTPE